MIAFCPLSANIALHIGVTTGFVTGVTEPTTPFALATRMMPVFLSSEMIPTDFLPLRLFQMHFDLPWHFATLSS